MATKDVNGYLAEQQRKSTGELAQEWNTIEELYNKKLWHQLTLRIQQIVTNPLLAQGDGLIKLYQNFISDFEHRISPYALADIATHVVKQIKDPKDSIEFLRKMQEKVKSSHEANILCLTSIGVVKLKQKDMEATKDVIREAHVALDELDGVTPVHGKFYELSSNYHKLMGHHAEYYREALRYLGCVDIKEKQAADRKTRAFNLGLAAILGKDVYNFGELLGHPILESLNGTDYQWLVDLLYAFNSGNLQRFEELRSQWQVQPDLAQSEIPMRQKISLLCLMEMTFKRPAINRQLSFQEIAAETRLPLNEVELLVMRALSLGLVKGSIDQIEQKAHMTWVQPRVLDRDQVGVMQKKLELWCTDVLEMEKFVQSKAQDILT